MFCCVCSGSCSHFGPHSYCALHEPQSANTVGPYMPQPFAPWSIPMSAPLSLCNGHCWCRTAPDNHKVCCNCGNRQRLDAPAEEKEKNDGK